MGAESLLGKGIAAAKGGEKAAAQQWLAKVVQEEPNRVEGWWWLAQVLDDEAQRRFCLDRARAIDSNYSGEPAVRPPAPQPPMKVTPPASATGPPSGPPPVEAASKPGSAGRPTFASARPPDSWPPAKPSERQTGSEAASGPVPTRPPEPKPHGRPSRIVLAGTVIGGAVLVGLVLIGIVALVVAPSRQSSAPAAFATLPPVWTDTPAPTPLPTSTPVPTMPPPTPDPLAGNEVAAQALALMEEEKYEEAIPLWDELLAQDPTNHAAYYERALSNLEASNGETIFQVYQLRVLQAIDDTDQAIALSDGLNGDYFFARAWAYLKLSGITDLRVDRDRLLEVALENIRRGEALPNTNPVVHRAFVGGLIDLGRCEEAEPELRRLVEERGPEAISSIGLDYTMGLLSVCLGEFDDAIRYLDRAIERHPDCHYYYIRGAANYHLGNTSKAISDMTLLQCPSYAGYRYYFKALIEQERGDTERALRDLQTGTMNTWGRGGLYPYVQSLIALQRGDRTQAVELLKQAEMTMEYGIGPFIERFQRELAALGEEPYKPTPEAYPASTPLAALPVGHPTPVPVRVILLTDGSGPLQLMPGSAIDLYFVPPSEFSYYDIASLELYLVSDQRGSPALEAKMFQTSEEKWQQLEVEWGANQLDDPGGLVNETGDVYLRLRALGPEPVVLQDVGLEMSVQERSGKYVKYSYQDE